MIWFLGAVVSYAVHATSALDPSWVGFADDECELLKAAYEGRSYYGAPAYTCGRCKTSFWYEERVKSASAVTEKRVVYNNCCKARKVFVKPFRHPPEFLRELMDFQGSARCSHFIERIRQYNCLFAFTSMGATIYRYVNDGRGPNVFKISGAVCHRVGSLLPRIGTLLSMLNCIYMMEGMRLIVEFRICIRMIGLQLGVKLIGVNPSSVNVRTTMTMQDYYCLCSHYREGQYNPYLCCGILSD
uniref:Uncharacterized protein n=1 Tax=Avena sativa TaxID=4498 RepID=A0ACD6AK14_AVESA